MNDGPWVSLDGKPLPADQQRRYTEALAEERKRQRETESVLETGIVAAGEKKR